MERDLCLIVNPTAGAGRAAKLLGAVEAELRGRGLRFRVERTTSMEHARECSRRAAAAGEIVAAMGGDGLTRALAAWKPARWTVTIDGETSEFDGYSVAVSNSGVYGSGMYLVPDAELDDGLLDVVLAEAIPKHRYLANLPKVFKGTHVDEP